jgi:hypothetical protein
MKCNVQLELDDVNIVTPGDPNLGQATQILLKCYKEFVRLTSARTR